MRQIQANLPALGAFRVNLFKESESLISYFGDEELRRLSEIDHLGAASVAFSGINHKRLEYVLIQCAIAQLVSKLYKDNADLALSNTVELDGLSKPISSGEELLKCWAILSNIGHPNCTFTTERAILGVAQIDNKFKTWLISGAVENDIKKWAISTIDEYEEYSSRFLITLLRLREERPNDPRKKLFRHQIRNKVLDLGGLKDLSPEGREKLSRLRFLSRNIQLLSMVTLDAYHSHSPIRLELLPAIQELAESATKTTRLRSFYKVIESAAGWLAEEVYLHPNAVAAQRSYEISAIRKLLKRIKPPGIYYKNRTLFLKNIMEDGFGQPSLADYSPLVRLSFPLYSKRLLSVGHRNNRIEQLTKEIGVNNNSIVSVDDNTFSRLTYVDVLYRSKALTAKQFGKTYKNLIGWLLNSMETDALERVRKMLPLKLRTDDQLEDSRKRILKNAMIASEKHLVRIIMSIIENIIPDGWNASFEASYSNENEKTIGWSFVDSKGFHFEEIVDRVDRLHKKNISIGNRSRAHEIVALKTLIPNPSAMLSTALLKPIILCDSHGKRKDEWDGVILEIVDDSISLTVIEAKGGAHKNQRAELAFRQLSETRKILRNKYSFNTKRKRISGAGAFLKVELFNK